MNKTPLEKIRFNAELKASGYPEIKPFDDGELERLLSAAADTSHTLRDALGMCHPEPQFLTVKSSMGKTKLVGYTMQSKPIGPKHICSFRAEFYDDLSKVLAALWTLRERYDLDTLTVKPIISYRFATLEPLVEITSDTVPPEEILAILQSIEDGHVMADTLAPVSIADNRMDRSNPYVWNKE